MLLYVVFGFSSLAVAVAVYERKDEALTTPFAFAVGTAAALAISAPPSPQERAKPPTARPIAERPAAGEARH